ncbi:hypothetical protein CXF32_10205, partial [Corynebacterium bovis]
MVGTICTVCIPVGTIGTVSAVGPVREVDGANTVTPVSIRYRRAARATSRAEGLPHAPREDRRVPRLGEDPRPHVPEVERPDRHPAHAHVHRAPRV